jgi:hypothetical protein
MSSNYGFSTGDGTAIGSLGTFLDEASIRQRLSRGSALRMSGAMRIIKPGSTSSSPRGSIGLSRRRTVTDARRGAAVADQHLAPRAFISKDGLQLSARSNRPVSWHPSSHTQQSTNSTTDSWVEESCIFDHSSTRAVYSGYGSPASTVSPYSTPYTSYSLHQNDATAFDRHFAIQDDTSQTPIAGRLSNPMLPTAGIMDNLRYTRFARSTFSANGFQNSSAPDSPDKFPTIQHPDPAFSAGEEISYYPLSNSEPEEEGEILCGLGLYDSPDIDKGALSDPQLDKYHSLVLSQLLGTSYRRESTGKGLKLEETWNPPISDEEEEEEELEEGNDDVNSEQDEEGEDGEAYGRNKELEDDFAAPSASRGIGIQDEGPFLSSVDYQTSQYERSGWL